MKVTFCLVTLGLLLLHDVYVRGYTKNEDEERRKKEDELVDVSFSFTSTSTVNSHGTSTSTVPEYCLTEECKNEANMILSYMNTTVDPCDDFYSFACGGFEKNMTIPNNEAEVSTFSRLNDKLHHDIIYLLGNKTLEKSTELWSSDQLARRYYESCTNGPALRSKGIEPGKEIIKQLGGFPVTVDQSFNYTLAWHEILLKVKSLGIPEASFFNISLGVDFENKSAHILVIRPPEKLGIKIENLLNDTFNNPGENDPVAKAYLVYMRKVSGLFGATRDRAHSDIGKVLKLQMELARLIEQFTVGVTEDQHNKTTIKDLQTRYAYGPGYGPGPPVKVFKWLDYINSILPDGTKVTEDEVVDLQFPDYFAYLVKVIENTFKQELVNYIVIRALQTIMDKMNGRARQLDWHLTQAETGQTHQTSREEYCSKKIYKALKVEVDSMYIRHYFNKEATKTDTDIYCVLSTKTVMGQMVKNIRNAFKEIIGENEWMDEESKKKAIEKCEAMEDMIGYPIEYMDQKKVEALHGGLILKGDTYLQNWLDLSLSNMKSDFSQLRDPVPENDWRHQWVTVVNAVYDLESNLMVIPAAVLQGECYDTDQPQYLNYGGIGFFVGHEITHGFDSGGSQIDGKGKSVNWWSSKTKDEFNAKVKCIVDQYSNVTSPETDTKLDGKLSKDENIADNGGVRAAYRAYNSWTLKNGKEKRLPGLDFNPQQMFWIGSGKFWCQKMTPEALKKTLLTSSNLPYRYRVNVPFSNLDEFAKDFNCSSGKKMNPEIRCSVW